MGVPEGYHISPPPWVWVVLGLCVIGPGLFPWLVGTLAGVCVRSKRLGEICGVSFAGGICAWLLTAGWVALAVTADWISPTDVFTVIFAGVVAVPLLAAGILATWAVRYGKRA